MSFKPLQFTYTPPRTVPSAPVAAATPATAAVQNPLDREGVAAKSNAARLLGRISSLKETSQYLQSAILALTANKGIVLNFAGDPELAESLKRIYGTTTPPSAISIGMYAHMIQAEFGIMRTDIALSGSGSSLQVSPYQRLDLQQSTKTVEDALVESGDFSSQLPLLLRELAGNDLICDSLSDGLRQYPVLSGTSFGPAESTGTASITNYTNPAAGNDFDAFQALGEAVGSADAPETASAGALSLNSLEQSSALSSMDCSPELTDGLDARFDQQTTLYGAMYDTIVSATGVVGAVNEDLTNVNQMLTSEALFAVDTVMCLMGAIKSIQAMEHKPTLKDLKDLATRVMLPRLIAELGPLTMMLDRMVQRVTSPVMQLLNRGNELLAQVAGVERNIAYLVRKDGLTGVIQTRIQGKPAPQMDTSALDEQFAHVDAGMKKLYGYAGWARKKIDAKSKETRISLLQAMDRSQQASGDNLELLQSLKDITNLLSVCQNAIVQAQGGGSGMRLTGISGQVSQALTGSADPVTGTALLLNQLPGGTVPTSAAVAQVPVPSPEVGQVLTTGGASLVNVVPFLRTNDQQGL
jgi:hypothetical protein